MNIYACLDSDNEDEPQVQKPKKEEKKKPAAPAAAPATAPKKETVVAAKKEDSKPATKDSSSAPQKSKDGEKKPKKENTPSNPRPESAAAPAAADAVDRDVSKDDNRGGRGRGRGGDRRERGGRGGRGRDSDRPYSEFKNDRQTHSTDPNKKPREPRKGGGGKFNVGNVNTEALNAEKDPSSVDPAVDGENSPDALAAEETTPEPEEPVVPEIPQISFDEYMAKRNEARANAEIFGQPKATRAVESDIPGVVKAEVKAEDVSVFILGLNKAKVAKEAGQQRSTSKSQVDVAFTVESSVPADEFPERGGRGRGRGGDRDRGGRGGGRGGDRGGDRSNRSPRPSGAKIDISDADAFPSL